MSKAFTKEDVEPPERSGRVRGASGLPPGAVNYISPRGARRLRNELHSLSAGDEENAGRIEDLERILASVTVVEAPERFGDTVPFGATVHLRDADDRMEEYRIVGVDELRFELRGVSWISPLGRALLASRRGDRVTLQDGRVATIASVEYAEE